MKIHQSAQQINVDIL